MKSIVALLSVILALCLLAGPAYAQAPGIPPEVEEAAKDGLEEFKGRVGPKPAAFGFADAEQVSRVTLAPGYQLHYLLDGDKLRNASGDSLLALVTPIQKWLYTVNVDGASKGFLIIGLENGQYRAVAGGGFTEDYGVALGNFRRLISAEGASVEPTLIQVVTDYYFAAKVGSREFVLPVASSERAQQGFSGGMDYTRLRPARDVVQHLQKVQQDGARRQQANVGGIGSVQDDPGRPDASQETSSSTPPSLGMLVWAGALALLSAGTATVVLIRRRRMRPKSLVG
ncbi:MAG TPA: hypothetical protein PLJ35_14530 [Anaerolineae bacterium]|nr:hypothetical protein [Anaerolineae bacterium]